ncbi:hypothetical protein ABIB25_001965 [Nakamurella sp. UYEF19]|uniref:DUF4129 domain-containing protein n=1 Tax=Nakamurella sp. UYEF19 TaxID=1756392 RepID=UPI003390F936
MRTKWPTPPPPVRVGLLVAAGVLLTGAALWAGSVGPWVKRPEDTSAPPTLPRITDLPTLPTLPTIPPISAPKSGGSSFDPTVVLWVLLAVLVAALLLIAAAMLRNRGNGGSTRRRRKEVPDPVLPSAPLPDPDRPFDAREAADYVIACWEELEQRAAARGTPRRPEQTPTEFIEALQAVYQLENRATAELLGLYQRARFDHVRLLSDTAIRARACVDVLMTALVPAWVAP